VGRTATAGKASGTGIWALRLTREPDGDVLVVRMAGRLGTAASGAFVEAIAGAIGEGHRRIVCDLTEVDYASSAGLLALDAVNGRMHAVAGRLVLCGLSDAVSLALEFAGLVEAFSIERSRDAAVSEARQPARLAMEPRGRPGPLDS
jgi:anti-sigma B factor antagonist/stage II sporulation protein AA (anti-sigma F factor antagonist)